MLNLGTNVRPARAVVRSIAAVGFAIGATLTRLARERRGNVFIIVAFAMVPMVFATGMGVDYSRAARLRTKLNAIADAAALAGVTQSAMKKGKDEARQIAIDMFNAQSKDMPNVINLELTVPPPEETEENGRTVTVSYVAESENAFGGILGRPTIKISGSSTANAIKAPYIDFYLLLDTSPSMLLPSTSAGLAQMRELTKHPDLPNGCAFACHTMNPHDDKIHIRDNQGKEIWLDAYGEPHSIQSTKTVKGVKYVVFYDSSGNTVQMPELSGNYADSYWLAYNNLTYNGGPNIEMRIDSEQLAVQALIPTAKSIADDNDVKYQMSISRFDYGPDFETIAPLTLLDSSNVPKLVDKATNLPMTYWYRNSVIAEGKNIDDQATDFKTAFNKMNGLISIADEASGSEDDPQKVLFIITDGMSDENLNGSRTHRELQSYHLGQCDQIKQRGIRIAILYTEYLPESLIGDSWSQSNVAKYLPKVAPALKQCATNPDGSILFSTVSTDDDIPAALQALFRQAVATAHLTD